MEKLQAMAAALIPWAALVGTVYEAAVVTGKKSSGWKLLWGLLAVCVLSGGVLFMGPHVLRQHDMQFRCGAYLLIIGAFFLSAVGMSLVTAVIFCRQEGIRWWERICVLLSGAVLFAVCLFSAFVFTAFTVQSEETGLWEGKKVVMIAVAGGGGSYRCHEYRGPVVMGKYLGTVERTQEERFGGEEENTDGAGYCGVGAAGRFLPVAEQRPDGNGI